MPAPLDVARTPIPSGVVAGVAMAPPSFEAVYDAHFAFVWRSARRLGVLEASLDDVVQEVFLVVHRRLAEFEGRSSLKTWLFGIALRVVRDHRRTGRRKPSQPTPPDKLERLSGADPHSPHDDLARAEATRALYTILDALDDDKREAFVMAELEQLSVPEIAQATGVNANTIYSRLRAARAEVEQMATRYRAREKGRLP